jgi:hypothetical protein
LRVGVAFLREGWLEVSRAEWMGGQ